MKTAQKKRYINFVIALLFAFTISANAQEDRKEKIEAMKVSFITQRLDLTSKEAQVFWPLYNELQDKLQAARKAKRKEAKQTRGDIDAMPDAEVEAIIDSEIAAKQMEAELAKEYHTKFKQLLTVKKVAKLYRAEDDFKRELLKQLQNK
jgi:hypothetical protein